MNRLWACGVFVAAIVLLGAGIEAAGIAAPFSDPVVRMRAQDESMYVNCALSMTADGDWLTPHFLGRPFLFKPPLLYWLSALSVKVLGPRLLAVRLPALLFGALACSIVFLWAAKTKDRLAGLFACALLLSNPLWHTYSRLCYADVIASAACMAAMVCLVSDSALRGWRFRLGFGAATAVAIMAKHIAGTLPLLALLVYCAAAGKEKRPSWRAIAAVMATVGLLVLPWHIFQFVVHPQWFWMDYIRIQLFQIGVNPPPQFNTAPGIVFYSQRMLQTDPVLLVLAAVALPGLLRALRERSSPSVLALASWMLVAGAALLAFRAENLPYLAFLIPALAVAAALGAPSAIARHMGIATAVLLAVMGAKAVAGNHPWNLRFGSAPPLPAASDLSWYCRQHRTNDLLLIEPDDEFTSATLALARVHYVVFDPAGDVSRSAPHYAPLGITVTTDQFLELDRWLPVFRLRLREWGSPSTQAVATAIVARSQEDEVRLVKALPDSDFYLSTNLLRRMPGEAASAHTLVALSNERCFLLAKRPAQHNVVRSPGPCAW
jgi:hypothetical protein